MHQDEDLQANKTLTLRDLPISQSYFEKDPKANSLSFISEFSELCLLEIPDYNAELKLPREIIGKIVAILEGLKYESDLDGYLPCLRLFSMAFESVSTGLVNTLVGFINCIKDSERFEEVGKVALKALEVLEKVVCNKKKKTEYYETAWGQKITSAVASLFSRLLKEKKLERLANWEFAPNGRGKSDFLLYVAKVLAGIVKHNTHGGSDIFYNSLPCYFEGIIEKIGENWINEEILVEKAVSAFVLINACYGFTSKLESIRSFIKIHLERLQNLYFYVVLHCCTAGFAVKKESFEEDNTVLGRVYKEIYELASGVAAHSDIENLPMLFFSVLLQPVYFI